MAFTVYSYHVHNCMALKSQEDILPKSKNLDSVILNTV